MAERQWVAALPNGLLVEVSEKDNQGHPNGDGLFHTVFEGTVDGHRVVVNGSTVTCIYDKEWLNA